MRKVQLFGFLILAMALGMSRPALAFWTFSSDQGYLRSTCTGGGSVGCDGDPAHSYSDPAGNNPPHVYQWGTGWYTAEFPGLGIRELDGGNVHVTALGGAGERCKVLDWHNAYHTITVGVLCFAPNGAPANSLFTVSYVQRFASGYPFIPNDGYGPEGAYVFASDKSNPSYDASTSPYAWNSTNGPILISHVPGTGTYNVVFSGQDAGVQWGLPSAGQCFDDNAGTVEVTAYGDDNVYCKAARAPMNKRSGRPLSNDTEVEVLCFDGYTGEPAESAFTLSYNTLSPNGTPSGGFVYGDQPYATTTYSPVATFSRQLVNTGDGNDCPHCITPASTITRVGTGLYNVLFPSLIGDSSAYTHVNVTGAGPGNDTCKVNDWWGDSGTSTVQVQCYTKDGYPVDANYFLNISTQEWIPS